MYEHGHYYDIFNAPFPPQSNLSKLVVPYGYICSRALAQAEFPVAYASGTSVQHTTWFENQFATWTINELKDHGNMELLLWALVTYLGEQPPSDTLIVSGNPTNLSLDATFGEIIPQYNDMINEWIRLKGQDYATNMLIAGVNYDVDPFVKLQPANVLVNIQGHTHVWDIERLQRADGSYIVYANSGAWVDAAIQTYVDVVYNGSSIVVVEVGSYASQTQVLLASCYLNVTTPCWAWRSTSGYWHWLIFAISFVKILLSS